MSRAGWKTNRIRSEEVTLVRVKKTACGDGARAEDVEPRATKRECLLLYSSKFKGMCESRMWDVSKICCYILSTSVLQ